MSLQFYFYIQMIGSEVKKKNESVDWFWTVQAAGGIMVEGIFSWYTLGHLEPIECDFKLRSLPEYWSWPRPSLSDYSIRIFWWLFPAGLHIKKLR